MKRAATVVAVLVIVIAYLAGFFPQPRQLSDAREQIHTLQDR